MIIGGFMLEVSAGGVVIHNGEFLLLKKFSNEWVLPKGRLENNEIFIWSPKI